MINYLIFLLFGLFLISGCATTKDVVIESEYIRSALNSGAVTETIDTGSLSSNDMLTLTHAYNKMRAFADKYDTLADVTEAGTDQLAKDYSEVRIAYISMYGIAHRNWDEYSDVKQDTMLKWDDKAREFNDNVKQLYSVQKYKDAAKQAVNFARAGLAVYFRIASK